ncbi:uncharacterized protein TNCV_2925171 [Trichonephila clavipes]|nr:uncharacterized protein TNCV_2925171 [Trichonephila clavipes]
MSAKFQVRRSIRYLMMMSETAVGERVWNGGAALVWLMCFGREDCLTPEGMVEGGKRCLVLGRAKTRGIVLDGMEWNSVGERATTGVVRFQKEVSQYVVGNSIKDLNLRGRKSKASTAWVLLQDNVEFRLNESFLSGDEDKARLYEIVNGSYNITFNWKVDDKNCSITMNASINGTVACTKDSEGLIWEDLDKDKDAKIRIGGTKNRKMTLMELVSLRNP